MNSFKRYEYTYAVMCQFTLLYCEHTVVENVSESLKYTRGMKYKKRFCGVYLFFVCLFLQQRSIYSLEQTYMKRNVFRICFKMLIFCSVHKGFGRVRSNPICSGCVVIFTLTEGYIHNILLCPDHWLTSSFAILFAFPVVCISCTEFGWVH